MNREIRRQAADQTANSNVLDDSGINVKIVTQDSGTFYDTLLSPSKLKSAKWGIVMTGWAADWPTGGGFLRSSAYRALRRHGVPAAAIIPNPLRPNTTNPRMLLNPSNSV